MFLILNLLHFLNNNSYLFALALDCTLDVGFFPFQVNISENIKFFFRRFLIIFASLVEFTLNLWSTIKNFAEIFFF